MTYVKYPRTYHLPWSPGVGRDDRVLKNTEHFSGKEVIVSVKMDGENTSMYPDYIHARSLDSGFHESRTWVKNLHNKIAHEIPEDWRICGENLYAKHSIHYTNLSSYFQVFSVWNEENICLSWKETVEWTNLLGLETVPLLYQGKWNEQIMQNIYRPELNGDECEGYAVRLADSFDYINFEKSIAKYVRKGHVQTDDFWMHKEIVVNGLKKQ